MCLFVIAENIRQCYFRIRFVLTSDQYMSSHMSVAKTIHVFVKKVCNSCIQIENHNTISEEIKDAKRYELNNLKFVSFFCRKENFDLIKLDDSKKKYGKGE